MLPWREQKTVWTGEKPMSLSDIGLEASNTIMLVEVVNSGIQWLEPRDLSVDALGDTDGKSPAVVPRSQHEGGLSFFYYDSPGVNVATADGSVHSLFFGGLSREELGKILQIGGCGPDVIDKFSQRRLNWPNIAALAVRLLSVGTLLTGAVRGRIRYIHTGEIHA